MYGEFLKWHISQLMTPIKTFFVAPLPGFDELHDDIELIISEVIKEIAATNSI